MLILAGGSPQNLRQGNRTTGDDLYTTHTAAVTHFLNQLLHKWKMPLSEREASAPSQDGPQRRTTGGQRWGDHPLPPHPAGPPRTPPVLLLSPTSPPDTLPRVGRQRAPYPSQRLCDSLFLHSLEFEDVHSLSVAGGRQEHAVHAEGQGADAHTPGARGMGPVTLPPGRGGQRATSTAAAPSGREVTVKEGPHDRCMRVFLFLSGHLLKIREERERLKADALTEPSFNKPLVAT